MNKERISSENIEKLQENEIFVFGSNQHGLHAGGAARVAYKKFGAVWGQGFGLQGKSFAIPTMFDEVRRIQPYIDEFIIFASEHSEYRFLVTRIGCGIAGYKDEEIAPLFARAKELENVALPEKWWNLI